MSENLEQVDVRNLSHADYRVAKAALKRAPSAVQLTEARRRELIARDLALLDADRSKVGNVGTTSATPTPIVGSKHVADMDAAEYAAHKKLALKRR